MPIKKLSEIKKSVHVKAGHTLVDKVKKYPW